ncbi:FmdB family zinc ribbon protein [Dietzia alimentaria]|uniref:FmdB family zinc ribbon protein n=1 Tax=Dietzia alimentaria TaxID=665550 RepID=UPI0009DA2405|nr:FmdB family zinc ribbon protein [Dietzia alimentaria]
MPLYQFRCQICGMFDLPFSMSAVPDAARCPDCGDDARRGISAPMLGRGNSPAMRLADATRRTASEPVVVSGAPPGRRTRPGTPVSKDPRQGKLPKP